MQVEEVEPTRAAILSCIEKAPSLPRAMALCLRLADKLPYLRLKSKARRRQLLIMHDIR